MFYVMQNELNEVHKFVLALVWDKIDDELKTKPINKQLRALFLNIRYNGKKYSGFRLNHYGYDLLVEKIQFYKSPIKLRSPKDVTILDRHSNGPYYICKDNSDMLLYHSCSDIATMMNLIDGDIASSENGDIFKF